MTRSKIKQARGRIEALRSALLSPDPAAIAAALPSLDEAVLCLQSVESHLRHEMDTAGLRRDLQLLKNDLRIVSRLIENGVAFCRGWARMLGAGPAYTQTGEPAPIGQRAGSGATLSLHG
jgi:hypothetical protein